MRGYRRLTGSLALSQLREPVGFFFTLIFAPALVVVLGLIFGNEPNPDFGGVGYITKTLPAFASLVLAITGVMVMPQQQLQLRETGALTRLRVTPLKPSTWIAADLTVNFVLGMLGMVLALAVGVIGFGVHLPQRIGSVLAASALGLVAFLALGYLLAAVYPSVGASVGIGNVLMILLMMTSGAFVPLAVLPEGAGGGADPPALTGGAVRARASRAGCTLVGWNWSSTERSFNGAAPRRSSSSPSARRPPGWWATRRPS